MIEQFIRENNIPDSFILAFNSDILPWPAYSLLTSRLPS